MKLDHVKALLAALGVFNVTYSGGGWAQCSCPLAPFTHAHGHDANPSFGVSVGDDRSRFNCFVCQRGSLADLLGAVDLYLQQMPQYKSRYNLGKAREILGAEEANIPVLPDYEELVPSPYTAYQAWPEWWLEQLPPWDVSGRSYDYVLHRGISCAATHFELHYDAKKDMLVAPIRNIAGELAGARGRAIELPGESVAKQWRHFDYAWNGVRNSHLIWFNETALDLPGPLVIVEGQFDAMRVWPHHKKVMAILSAKATPFKMAKLTGEDAVVLMLDNDLTGKTKTAEWAEYLQRKNVQVGLIDLPEGVKDAGAASEEWLHKVLADLTMAA